MSKKWLPQSIAAVVLAVFSVLGQGCESSPPPTPNQWAGVVFTGENEPLLEGTVWAYADDQPPVTVSFGPGGKLIGLGNPDKSHTWQRNGNTVKMVISSGYVYMEGTYYPANNTIMGSAQNSKGQKWDWTMTPGIAARAASSPSGSASPAPAQNVTKTYNGQIYYEMNGTRMSQPFVVQATSPTEAIALARSRWQSTNYNNYKLIDVAVMGSF